MNHKLLIFALAATLVLQGCVFGGRKDDSDKPAELQPLATKTKVQKLWSARIGGDAKNLRLGLRPASDGTRVFAAAYDGAVSGFDLVTGRRDWRTDTDARLSAGPGYGDGLVVVGSVEGDVIALEADNGAQRWRTFLKGEILAAPAIGAGTVVLRTVNGGLVALEASTGAVRWRYEQPVPRLSLRGNARPAIGMGQVIAGFDNGRIVSIRLSDGVEVWQAPLAIQRGRTELERLADIDSDVVITGEEIFVAGFQSRAAMISLTAGRPVWAEELSSAGGIAVDWTGLYATAADGVVQALDRKTGAAQWTQDALVRRRVSGPEAFGEAIVVGDFDGYLHWLSSQDGKIVARARAGNAAIVAAPMAVGDRLFVQDESGTLHAFGLPR